MPTRDARRRPGLLRCSFRCERMLRGRRRACSRHAARSAAMKKQSHPAAGHAAFAARTRPTASETLVAVAWPVVALLCVRMVCKTIVQVADQTAEVAGNKRVQAAAVLASPLARAVDLLENVCTCVWSRARSLPRCPDAACGPRPTRRAGATACWAERARSHAWRTSPQRGPPACRARRPAATHSKACRRESDPKS